MPVAFKLEVLEVNLELAAASREVMQLVRSGKAFGQPWKLACERENKAYKNWRKVIGRPYAPSVAIKASTP
jgi:hypothetical protein